MMKRVMVIMTLFVLVASLFANDLQQPNKVARELENFQTRIVESGHRDAPTVEFILDPVEITASYYDYMPGGYNTTPLRTQPEFAGPSDYPAGGKYFAFMFQENATSQRRVYYIYINADGTITSAAPISSANIREGFAGITIDPVTANPFVAWHANTDDGDNFYECPFTYDMFNVVGTPGLWKLPYNLIDNPMEDFAFAGEGDYIWPVLNIGPSPIAGKRRLHIYANFAPNGGGAAEYNCIYGYSDVSYDENTFDMVFDGWNFQTFPEWDQWQIDLSRRAIKEIAVSPIDGQVVFVGHGGQDMFAMYSDNYGETFEYREHDFQIPLDNPLNEDGTPYFDNEDGSESVIFFEPNSDGSHYNAIFTDDATKIVFMSSMGINSEEGVANGTYMPAIFHPKMFVYDTVTDTYTFTDLQVTGVDPNDDQPMIPWDLDEDGEVDDYYEDDGTVVFADVWPTYYYAGDAQGGSFHESLFKVSALENWVVVLFQDGRKLRQAYWENPDFEDWAETPEIAIAVSSDFGVTWSDVAYMNANPNDENFHTGLDGMTPVYVYAGDGLTEITPGGTHGALPIVFFDDNSFGSASGSNQAGQPNGGTVRYAIIDVDFGQPCAVSVDGTEIPELFTSVKNYPNPFNPTTTISFNMKAAGNVTLNVFNARGQKVNTLIDGYRTVGTQTASWNGNDSNGKAVSSGIYFYKLSTDTASTTKKMVLMK